MKVINTRIKGLLIIEPVVFKDERGYFLESFSENKFHELIGKVNFIQDNESKSTYGVLRGLHFQKGEHAQAKLVRVIKGKVLDVAVDLRPGSLTYGKHVSIELSGDNKRQFFIPRHFAHGFLVLSEEAIFQYKCDNYYAPSSEGGIKWDDPELAIDWKVPHSDILVSKKDNENPFLKTLEKDFN